MEILTPRSADSLCGWSPGSSSLRFPPSDQ
jgi:hypothetical protein